ncbi:MAG: glycosyltransferase [Candidatus Eiseniibacteriota bacterium]|nr:MAG: glycosyltransferase [Candidatus Eisenbacteria bacterium]
MATRTAQREVLMLAHFFPPLGGGGVQRTSKFVKYLPDFGWTPVVVTVKESAYWVKDSSLEEDLPSGLHDARTLSPSVFYLLKLLPGGGGLRKSAGSGGEVSAGGERSGALFARLRKLSSFFLIPDQYVGWVPFAVSAGLRCMRERSISVLYSTSSPDSTHLAGLLLKRLTGRPWVADFRDPWTERLTFSPPTPLHLGLNRLMESRVVSCADRVVCTSEETARDFLKKYPRLPREKFVVITNGFDPDDFGEEIPLREKFTVTHTGNLTGRRNCFDFLEGLRTFLEKKPEARQRTEVLLMGPRDSENELRSEELGLADIVVFGDTLPHKESVRLQLSSHLLLLMEHHSRRGALIYPAKVFEYAASGRAVLALVPEGPAARFVRNVCAGTVISTPNPAAVFEALSRFFDAYEAGSPIGGPKDRSALVSYERPALARQLAGQLDLLHGVDPRSSSSANPLKNMA